MHEIECALLGTKQILFPSFCAPSVLFDQGAMHKEKETDVNRARTKGTTGQKETEAGDTNLDIRH